VDAWVKEINLAFVLRSFKWRFYGNQLIFGANSENLRNRLHSLQLEYRNAIGRINTGDDPMHRIEISW